MAEYLLLATFVTVLAVSTVWTIRTMKYIGRVCYQAFLPSAKNNVKKDKKPVREELRTLSEALADVRMPWGWQPIRLAGAHNASAGISAPVVAKPTVVPWGWPGNPGRAHGHKRGSVSAAGQSNGRQAQAAYYGGLDSETPGMGKDLLANIRGTQFGGFYVVKDGQAPARDARSPWGW